MPSGEALPERSGSESVNLLWALTALPLLWGSSLWIGIAFFPPLGHTGQHEAS